MESFDPSTLSQITSYLIVTDEDGVRYGKTNGHWFSINTAAEIYADAQVKIPVPVPTGRDRHEENVVAYLDMIADTIKMEIDHNPSEKKQIVLFCALGMERSPLAAAWYLSKYEGYTLESAYKRIRSIRPIICDRTFWVDPEQYSNLDKTSERQSWNLLDAHRQFI